MQYPYLNSRQGTRNYLYRRGVPPELRQFFSGKREVTKTLGTSDKQEAILQYLKIAPVFEEQFMKARQGLPTGTEFDKIKRKRVGRYNKAKKNVFAYADETGTADLYDPNDSLDEHFFFVEDSRLRIEISGLQRDKKIGVGDARIIDGKIQDREHLIAGTVPATEPPAASGPMFSKVVAKYLAERRKGRITPRGLLQIEREIREFREKIGDRPIDGYTKKNGRKYFAYLQNKPARGKRGQRLNPATINTKIGYISKLFSWAIPRYDEDIINPLEGFRLERIIRKGKDKTRLPFTYDELEIMVSLLDKKPVIYWPTLIAIYTGMREGEIIQLRKKDIKTEDGILYFDVHEENENLKTESSIKQIPVHKTLLKLGFAEFVKKTRTVQLFANFACGPRGLKEGKNDAWADKFYKQWVYFLKKHGVIHDKIDFHSLRGNFSDACRNNSVPEFIWGWLQGRAEKGSVGDYGIGPDMKTKKTEIDKIKYGLTIEG